jgi:RNA methyltransferase, TrmH family
MQQKWKKLIRSLQQKKNRQAEGLFLVEGEKSVQELLAGHPSHLGFEVVALFCTDTFAQAHPRLLGRVPVHELVKAETLAQAGTLETNDGALVLVRIPEAPAAPAPLAGLTLALSDLRDPGNLGAIIRIADWYGIGQVVCSPTTTDWYSPKVIAASMGSFLRVRPFYTDLSVWLATCQVPVLGAFLTGESIHQVGKLGRCVLLIGNEAQGIAPALEPLVSRRVTIPRFGGAESLNAAMATAILCDNLRREQV